MKEEKKNGFKAPVTETKVKQRNSVILGSSGRKRGQGIKKSANKLFARIAQK